MTKGTVKRGTKTRNLFYKIAAKLDLLLPQAKQAWMRLSRITNQQKNI